MYKRIVVIGLVAAMLGACGRGNVRASDGLQVDADSALLVLGVNHHYLVQMTRGPIVGNTWTLPWRNAAVVDTFPDESGYIVVKVKPTTDAEKLGLSRVFPDLLHPYGPCQGYKTPVFTLRAGTITYAGDLDYNFDGSQLRFSVTSDVEKARAYLKSKYSNAEPLEFRPMELLTVNSGFCQTKTLMVPIFIPATRR